jgi:hypothetical protein
MLEQVIVDGGGIGLRSQSLVGVMDGPDGLILQKGPVCAGGISAAAYRVSQAGLCFTFGWVDDGRLHEFNLLARSQKAVHLC